MKRTPLKRNTPLRSKKNWQTKSSLKRGTSQLKKSWIKRKTKTTRTLSNGMKIWTLDKCHNEFSKHIRERDGMCLRCHSKQDLTCSHFHGRSNKATAFHLENCITLCRHCHEEWEVKKKPGQEYYEFMRGLIGEEKMSALEILARSMFSESQAVYECMEYLKEFKKEALKTIKY